MFNVMLKQQNYSNPIMPLLIEFTPSTEIQTADEKERLVYNENEQIIPLECGLFGIMSSRQVGTKCLKQFQTDKKNPHGGTSHQIDNKNEIDDSKTAYDK